MSGLRISDVSDVGSRGPIRRYRVGGRFGQQASTFEPSPDGPWVKFDAHDIRLADVEARAAGFERALESIARETGTPYAREAQEALDRANEPRRGSAPKPEPTTTREGEKPSE